MTLPYEWLIAIKDTRAVMSEIIATKKIRVDEKLRKRVRGAMKHLPMDMEMEHMISVYQKVMTEWGKPEAEKKGYIAIGRYDPVEYSPSKQGWIFWFEDWATHSRVYFTEQDCRAGLLEYLKTKEVNTNVVLETETPKKTTKKKSTKTEVAKRQPQ